MKICFNPKDLLPKLRLAKAATTAKDVKPVLQNVKIVADKAEDLPAECRAVAGEPDVVPEVEVKPEIEIDDDVEDVEVEPENIAVESAAMLQWSTAKPGKAGLYVVYSEINNTSYKRAVFARLLKDSSGKMLVNVAADERESLDNFCRRRKNIFWLPADDEFLIAFLRELDYEIGLSGYLPNPIVHREPVVPAVPEVESEAASEPVAAARVSTPPTATDAPLSQHRPSNTFNTPNGGKRGLL